MILMAGIALNNGHYAGRVAEQNVWPVTYLMLQAVEGGAELFLYIVATLYAAELIWRERDTHFAGIHDALPIAETTDWFSKLFALCFVEIVLLTVTGLCGILMQTVAGYYHYELAQYAKELYLVTFPQVLTFALLALFIQTVVSNKFIGHGIVIGIFVIIPILFSFGWENTLYLFGNTPPYTYSDMNGYGHFVPALFWSITYWLSISCVLGVISIALARRGADDAWPARFRLAAQRAPRLIPAAAVFLLVAIGSGAWYFYNAHVLNEYLTAQERRDIRPITSVTSRSTSTWHNPRSSPSTPTSTFFPSAAPSPARATSCFRTRPRSRSARSTSPTRSSPSRTCISTGRSTLCPQARARSTRSTSSIRRWLRAISWT